ncbi:uncharacterized protein MONBRDRAFT_11714 [Monosiga brevicollis MX1]|uniref:Sulfotransferase domain-containing protein n=1 Tax=Monosiga brevicollis TaxID=81824 RepID=A9VA26_MONBE|nr:uncharacterized protein MONBRDRAFT_11714 [Monosiga brevicollis MX1]EDQ85592.1 predicted protein [Monosiga brevicollis MX1]|eukprot:XP_001749541.1 hypothetical protein [Monosiga brevicollis MX1]
MLAQRMRWALSLTGVLLCVLVLLMLNQPAAEPPSRGGVVVGAGQQYRLVLASIARSGNGWMRGMLEASTGVATESVFEEPGAKSSGHGSFVPACGWLQDCTLVQPASPFDAAVIKSHFPFASPDDVLTHLRAGQSDVQDVHYALVAVRNPLDNFEAWELRAFMDIWSLHHDFWWQQHGGRFIYRYEDLLQDPIAVLRKLLHHAGLWTYYGLQGIMVAFPLLRCLHTSWRDETLTAHACTNGSVVRVGAAAGGADGPPQHVSPQAERD